MLWNGESFDFMCFFGIEKTTVILSKLRWFIGGEGGVRIAGGRVMICFPVLFGGENRPEPHIFA